MNWSDTLAAHAQVWADDLANRDAFEHDNSRGLQGENLYKSSRDSTTACKNGTYAFYKEEKYYHYDNPGFSMAVGHFTQVHKHIRHEDFDQSYALKVNYPN